MSVSKIFNFFFQTISFFKLYVSQLAWAYLAEASLFTVKGDVPHLKKCFAIENEEILQQIELKYPTKKGFCVTRTNVTPEQPNVT